MRPQCKERLEQFIEEFWSKRDNLGSLEASADLGAEAANCSLVRGNVALMSGFVITEQEFEKWCGEELRFSMPDFIADRI